MCRCQRTTAKLKRNSGLLLTSYAPKGGEFFTPTAIVKLIVEIIEPFSGRIFDPLLPKLISGEIDVERLEIAGVEETGEAKTKAVEV